eukprot:3935643-Rhodomonas_salina.1
MASAIACFYFIPNPMVATKDTESVTYYDTLMHFASFISPILIWMSPQEHHSIIALETSLPIGAVLAISVLYMMSPVAPYMLLLHEQPTVWPFFSVIPMVIPVLILCVINAFRRGFTIIIPLTTLCWLLCVISNQNILKTSIENDILDPNDATATTTPNDDTSVNAGLLQNTRAQTRLVCSFILLVVISISVFVYLIWYRYKHIMVHNIYPATARYKLSYQLEQMPNQHDLDNESNEHNNNDDGVDNAENDDDDVNAIENETFGT